MEVLNIDKIEGRRITVPGMTRVLKDILVTNNMTTHLGVIPPGQVTSEHSHPKSEEIVYVVKGRGTVTSGGKTRSYGPNHLVYIPEGVLHQYRNDGDEELLLFVVYSPPAEVPKR